MGYIGTKVGTFRKVDDKIYMENYISLFNWYKLLSFKRKLHYIFFSGKEIKKYKLKKKEKEKAEERLVQSSL